MSSHERKLRSNRLKPFVDKSKNPHLGRRTGKDILAGKTIKKNQHGIEKFADYFTDEENDCELSSICAVSPKEYQNVLQLSAAKENILNVSTASKVSIPSINKLQRNEPKTSSPLVSENNLYNQGKNVARFPSFDGISNITQKSSRISCNIDKNISLSSIHGNHSLISNTKLKPTPKSSRKPTSRKSPLTVSSACNQYGNTGLTNENSKLTLSSEFRPSVEKRVSKPHAQTLADLTEEANNNSEVDNAHTQKRPKKSKSKAIASIIRSLGSSPYKEPTDKSDSDESEEEFLLESDHNLFSVQQSKLHPSSVNKMMLINQQKGNNEPKEGLNHHNELSDEDENVTSDEDFHIEPVQKMFSLQQFKVSSMPKKLGNKSKEEENLFMNSQIQEDNNSKETSRNHNKNKKKTSDKAEKKDNFVNHKGKATNRRGNNTIDNEVNKSKNNSNSKSKNRNKNIAPLSSDNESSNYLHEIDDNLSGDDSCTESSDCSQANEMITEPSWKQDNNKKEVSAEEHDETNSSKSSRTNVQPNKNSRVSSCNEKKADQKRQTKILSVATTSKVITKKSKNSNKYRKTKTNKRSAVPLRGKKLETSRTSSSSVMSDSEVTLSESKYSSPTRIESSPTIITSTSKLNAFISSAAERKKPEIIQPSANANGLRRSQRCRVPTLEFWRNEKAKYQRDPNIRGVRVLVGIESPTPNEEIKRPIKNKPKPPAPAPAKDLVCIPDNGTLVINPDTNTEVKINCVGVESNSMYYGLDGNPSSYHDKVKMCKTLQQPSFSCGFLTLKPNAQKPRQSVKNHMVKYLILKGQLMVTIHESEYYFAEKTVFFVPSGNCYSIKNVGSKEAELYYTIFHY